MSYQSTSKQTGVPINQQMNKSTAQNQQTGVPANQQKTRLPVKTSKRTGVAANNQT